MPYGEEVLEGMSAGGVAETKVAKRAVALQTIPPTGFPPEFLEITGRGGAAGHMTGMMAFLTMNSQGRGVLD